MNETWEAVRRFFSREFLGVPWLQWVLFLTITLVLMLVLGIILRTVLGRLKRAVTQTHNTYDDYLVGVLERTRWFGLLGLSLFLALYCVALGGPYTPEVSLRTFALVLVFLQVGYWGTGLIDVVLQKGFQATRVSESTRRSSAGVVRWFALVFIWGCVFLLILSAFNIEITPLLAGLGVGGIAIAFALQQILSDVFCSVAIVLDRPFEVGDFIITGEHMGTVEHIGIKTTHLRSLGGEQIIIPNSDLLGSRIRNYKRMQERRIVFGFGVLYSTSVDKLNQIPDLVKEVITAVEKVRFDRAHFQSFGDSALQFEVVYYVLSPDFNLYMDIQQQINLEILRRFQALEIEMAFPSRTLYLDRESAAVFARSGNHQTNQQSS
jgi:small-conductance mechanosensitive channel